MVKGLEEVFYQRGYGHEAYAKVLNLISHSEMQIKLMKFHCPLTREDITLYIIIYIVYIQCITLLYIYIIIHYSLHDTDMMLNVG